MVFSVPSVFSVLKDFELPREGRKIINTEDAEKRGETRGMRSANLRVRWNAAKQAMIVETQPFWRLRGGGESRKLYMRRKFACEKCSGTRPGYRLIH